MKDKARKILKGHSLNFIILPIISVSYKKCWSHMVHLSKKARGLVFEYLKNITLLAKVTEDHYSVTCMVTCSANKSHVPRSLLGLHNLAHAHPSTWNILPSLAHPGPFTWLPSTHPSSLNSNMIFS